MDQSDVAYVSLPPESIPGGHSATISNPRNGVQVTVAIVEGGFDPVPITAAPGDTVNIGVAVAGGGSPVRLALPVPEAAKPRVVRTQPPHKKRDVVLNAILVVFSEPIDSATLSTENIRLRRSGERVDGSFQFQDPNRLVVEFLPDVPLASNADYELVITQGVQDLDGEALEAPVVVSFTTAESTGSPGLSVQKLSGDGQTDTVLATLTNAMRVLVLRDGRPVPGVDVNWSATYPPPQPGSGSVSFATSRTDATGVASANFTLGRRASTCLGALYQATASVAGASGSPAVFRATALPGAPVEILPYLPPAVPHQVQVVGGTVQWAAFVTDRHFEAFGGRYGNGVPGVTVEWTVASGDGAVSPTSTLSPEPGGCQGVIPWVTHTLGPSEGDQEVVATAPSIPGSQAISFTATGVTTLVDVGGFEFAGQDRFIQDSVVVAAGRAVGWRWVCNHHDNNNVCSSHNVTFEDDPSQPTSSATLEYGGVHARTFTNPGVYRYRCTNHSESYRSGMVGMVVVR